MMSQKISYTAYMNTSKCRLTKCWYLFLQQRPVGMTGGIRPATQVKLFSHVIDLLEENIPLKMTHDGTMFALYHRPPKHVALCCDMLKIN